MWVFNKRSLRHFRFAVGAGVVVAAAPRAFHAANEVGLISALTNVGLNVRLSTLVVAALFAGMAACGVGAALGTRWVHFAAGALLMHWVELGACSATPPDGPWVIINCLLLALAFLCERQEVCSSAGLAAFLMFTLLAYCDPGLWKLSVNYGSFGQYLLPAAAVFYVCPFRGAAVLGALTQVVGVSVWAVRSGAYGSGLALCGTALLFLGRTQQTGPRKRLSAADVCAIAALVFCAVGVVARLSGLSAVYQPCLASLAGLRLASSTEVDVQRKLILREQTGRVALAEKVSGMPIRQTLDLLVLGDEANGAQRVLARHLCTQIKVGWRGTVSIADGRGESIVGDLACSESYRDVDRLAVNGLMGAGAL